jgi:hypothetical protein
MEAQPSSLEFSGSCLGSCLDSCLDKLDLNYRKSA